MKHSQQQSLRQRDVPGQATMPFVPPITVIKTPKLKREVATGPILARHRVFNLKSEGRITTPDGEFVEKPWPASRTSDPASSHNAEAAMDASGQRQRDIAAVVELVKNNPGLVGSELDLLTGTPVHGKASKRLIDAERMGLIERGPYKISAATGREGATWRIKPK